MGQDSFDVVVETHHGEIRRYLSRVTRRTAEADDLTQETFLRAYRHWRGLPADANVRAWLFTIATNLSRNHLRGDQRRARAYHAVQAALTEPGPASADGGVVFNETMTLVERIVDRLPFQQRAAFVLRKVHALPYEAIGAALACSGETARAHVFQALRKIRQALDHHDLPRTEVPR